MFKPYLFKPYMGKGRAFAKMPTALLLPGGVRAALAQMAVCEALDVHPMALFANGRGKRKAAFARQTAMYLCRLVFKMTLHEIAECFDRDRTTVAHAVLRIEEAREDTRFDAKLRKIEALLRQVADSQPSLIGGGHG